MAIVATPIAPAKKYKFIEFLKNYGISGAVLTLSVGGLIALGRLYEQWSIHKETEETNRENAALKETNELLLVRIDSLEKCCTNNAANKTNDNANGNK